MTVCRQLIGLALDLRAGLLIGRSAKVRRLQRASAGRSRRAAGTGRRHQVLVVRRNVESALRAHILVTGEALRRVTVPPTETLRRVRRHIVTARNTTPHHTTPHHTTAQ